MIPSSSLSQTEFKMAYGNKDILITGQSPREPIENLQIQITAKSKSNGNYSQIINLYKCDDPVLPSNITFQHECLEQSPAEKFMERLWAYKRIKILLDADPNEDCTEALDEYYDDKEMEKEKCQTKAIELALKYNFVTDLTSLVVESQNDDDEDIKINNDNPRKDPDDDENLQNHSIGSSSIVNNNNYPTYDVHHSINIPNYYDYENDFASVFTPAISARNCTNGNLTLYSRTYFRGEQTSFEETNIASFIDYDFDDKLASVKIEGYCCWKICVDQNFQGNCMELKGPVEYKSATEIREIFRKASSAKLVPC